MSKGSWTKAIKTSADPKRAAHFHRLLLASPGREFIERASEEQARVLAALLAGSEACATLLMSHPEWLMVLCPEVLKYPRRKEGLEAEIKDLSAPPLEARDYTSALRTLREFKHREMLRIAARDLAGFGKVAEITLEISSVADICLQLVWQICHEQLVERYGRPLHQDALGRWIPVTGCVLGMGKLGGEELNYSSDVDVMFVYTDEGSVFKTTPGRGKLEKPTLSAHQFFKRLAEAFIAEVNRTDREGPLYRIDLRLRPEGDAGPLSRSLPSYENYYAQWGQTWERMMLIKTRGVAGDPVLASEFIEAIQHFRYPRSVNENALQEIAAIKARIEKEVLRSDELDRNIKLGRGGIREIEFIVQALQLLHAGRQPFLQGAQTLPCLRKLAQYELVSNDDAWFLADAYEFLRNLEHRLQMDKNLQTHTIPIDAQAQERLARTMGFSNRKKFYAKHAEFRTGVRAIFDKLLKTESRESEIEPAFPAMFEGNEAKWKKILSAHHFRDPDTGFRVLREFVEGPGYVHVSPRTTSLAYELLPRLFRLCLPASNGPGAQNLLLPSSKIHLSDPDRVVTRLDSFIAAYGARSTLFGLWNSTPKIFELLLMLFDRSEFLAELAIREPDLVDELVTSDRLRVRKTAAETLADLRHGLADQDQSLWLRKYHQAELMRIGLRDILGLADFEQYLIELSSLADACLQYALEVTMRRHRKKVAPFAIIGLGKLGGAEIDYGSDLDILFVADSKEKELTRAARLAVEVMDLVSKRTEHGALFHTDARLRPDGEKGILVNTLKAFEEYYRHRAQLWEIQSLTRTRFVAGNAQVGKRFQQVAADLTNFKKPNLPLAAFSPDWKSRIDQMRRRIEMERTPRGKDLLAIKTGSGGLVDAEFVAQVSCMENGWQEANTLRALECARQTDAAPGLPQLIENYRALRRVEGILRRWSYEGETLLPHDPAPFYRVSVRCGFDSPEAFREVLASCRGKIRQVYDQVFKTKDGG